MKFKLVKRIRWFHIVIIVIVALLLMSLSPVYPARLYSSEDGKALVVITFDDGYESWITEAMPVLLQYNMPATGFINNPEIRDGFTWEDARELANAGWEIGWHTANHVPVDNLQRSEIEDDFSLAAPLLESNGLPAPVTFAYPSGRHDSLSLEVASEYFLASRTMETGVNTPFDVRDDPQHLKQFSMEKGLDYLEKKVNKYAGQDLLIIFTGHTIGELARWQSKPDITVEDFQSLVEFLHQQEEVGTIDVVTLKEAVERMQQREIKYSWHLQIDSPFDTWYRFWIIPVPERYYIYFQVIVQDGIGHRFPQIVRWFDRY
jgi:peptidoglycan/xylan/chitin deacetylase (PgdA/CDA1 family)